MKKKLLAFGSLMAIAAPISAVISCGNDNLGNRVELKRIETNTQASQQNSHEKHENYYDSATTDPYTDDKDTYVRPGSNVVTPITQINTQKWDEYANMKPTAIAVATQHVTSEEGAKAWAGKDLSFESTNVEAFRNGTTIALISRPENPTAENQQIWLNNTKINIEAFDANNNSLGMVFISKPQPQEQLANRSLVQYELGASRIPAEATKVKVKINAWIGQTLDTFVDYYVGDVFTPRTINKQLANADVKVNHANPKYEIYNELMTYVDDKEIYKSLSNEPTLSLSGNVLNLPDGDHFNVVRSRITREVLAGTNAIGVLLSNFMAGHISGNPYLTSIKIKDSHGQSIFETRDVHASYDDETDFDFDFYAELIEGKTSVFEFKKDEFSGLVNEHTTEAEKKEEFTIELTVYGANDDDNDNPVSISNELISVYVKSHTDTKEYNIPIGTVGTPEDPLHGVSIKHNINYWGPTEFTKYPAIFKIPEGHEKDWWLAKNYLNEPNQGAENDAIQAELDKPEGTDGKMGSYI